MRGINDRAQLADAEAVLQTRLREAAMRAGATLIAPATVSLASIPCSREDVTIEPYVVFGPGVTVGEGAPDPLVLASRRRACRQERASSDRLRGCGPGATLAQDVRIGNFVEVKAVGHRRGRQGQPSELYRRRQRRRAAPISAPAPSPAITTASANIETEIGDGAFIGSNTRLVAPVEDRRRRLCRLGLGDHAGRRAPNALALARGLRSRSQAGRSACARRSRSKAKK